MAQSEHLRWSPLLSTSQGSPTLFRFVASVECAYGENQSRSVAVLCR